MRKFFYGLLLFIFFMVQCQKSEEKTHSQSKKVKASSIQPVRATLGAIGAASKDVKVKEFEIRPNESLYVLLNKFGFSPSQIYQITQKAKKVFDVQSFKPGQDYKAYISKKDSAELQKLVWYSNPVDFVVFNWQKDSLQIYKASKPILKKTNQISGTITSSLYDAISDKEARDELVYMMTEILAWQIDFFNLRDGDSFKILYEKKYVEDEYFDLGKVLAVKFKHMDDTYFAYKFQKGEYEGYFDEQGNSVQKALLKTPFKYDYRISSHYGMRFHPILETYTKHSGTDYAAPFGTPVRATGNGVVVTAGYFGAEGNMIKIHHNGTYETAYMHMSDFADDIYVGAHVDQGEVIGFVGSTGRSTGAHLHYSVYRNGTPVNSLTLDLPPSRSLPDKFMDEFKKIKNRLNEKLLKGETMFVSK